MVSIIRYKVCFGRPFLHVFVADFVNNSSSCKYLQVYLLSVEFLLGLLAYIMRKETLLWSNILVIILTVDITKQQ
jgi:hypothetical protein